MQLNSKIYIAGHRGLVGSAIMRNLEVKGYKNIIGMTHHELDLTDQDAVEKFFASEKPEYVFLAAAKVGGIMANNTYRADFIYDNLRIQDNVVGASYRHKVKKLLFLGSVCIYPKFAEVPVSEDSLLTGELEYTNEPYAIAKIAGIKLIESFNLQYGTNYLSVMPTNLYGENDNFNLETSHVMPALIRKMVLAQYLAEGRPERAAANLGIDYTGENDLLGLLSKYGIERGDKGVVLKVWGSGKPYREFLHADDMADACIHVMNSVDFKDVTKGMKEVRNTHINIGTGSDVSIKDLAYMIKEIVGFSGNIEFDTTKPDGTPRRTMSVDKLNRLGWHHDIELEPGIKRTVSWYKDHQDTL